MTVMEDDAPGVSMSSLRDIPKACAMRRVTARVGVACSRSISLNMERLTPLAPARASRDQSRLARRSLTRAPRCRLMASAGSFAGLVVVLRGIDKFDKPDFCL